MSLISPVHSSYYHPNDIFLNCRYNQISCLLKSFQQLPFACSIRSSSIRSRSVKTFCFVFLVVSCLVSLALSLSLSLGRSFFPLQFSILTCYSIPPVYTPAVANCRTRYAISHLHVFPHLFFPSGITSLSNSVLQTL